MLDSIITLKFSDSKIPVFKKVSNKPYILFGEDDDYPDYLLYLYNKSAKHNAIINGKINYIFGGGLKSDDAKTQEWMKSVNRTGETLEEITRKSLVDIEVFGGFAWQIIFNSVGQVAEIYNLEFAKVRSNKDNTEFYYKRDWKDRQEEVKCFPAFDIKTPKTSVFYFGEYRPGCSTYSLPGYVGSINFIESDIEVSKHTLTNAKTGFSASKFINFYNGEPEEDKKKEITRRFENRNTGSEGKKVIVAFNNDPLKKPTIDDLGTSDLTKEDFQAVDNLISSNIYAGHQITSPILFGIKSEGQLGGTSELRIAYDIFKNTYVKNKQQQFEQILNEFAKIKGGASDIKFIPANPVGLDFSETILKEVAPRSWLLEQLGIDTTKYSDGPAVVSPSSPVQPVQQASVNDNLKNLTGKQHQQLLRIIRQFSKGQLTEEAAKALLKSSLGLNDEDINSLLGITPEEQEFSHDFSEEEIADMFSEIGEERPSFEILKSKEVNFSSDKDCLEFELNFFQSERFEEEVAEKKTSIIDKIKTKLPKLQIKYSYEPRPGLDPIIETTRPFCRKLIGLDRFYSRMDIEKVSERVGYSVWDRRGGFWGNKPYCRHIWKMHVVIKK